jgi:hypothetical protein
VRYLLLVMFPAVASADASPPPPNRSNSAGCLARLENARREFTERASMAVNVVEQDDGALTYIACEGDPPEVDCDMHAAIARDQRATGHGSWRMRRRKRATLYEVEWTRLRATIGYECFEWPCAERSRIEVFLSVFRAALDACLAERR